jgi:hypothetical protein
LNARADLAQFRRLLEHLDLKPGPQQTKSSGQAPNTSANDDDSHPYLLLRT